MSRFKRKKPCKRKTEKTLAGLLDRDIPLEEIDANFLDEVIYWYPSLYLKWQSSREQKARDK